MKLKVDKNIRGATCISDAVLIIIIILAVLVDRQERRYRLVHWGHRPAVILGSEIGQNWETKWPASLHHPFEIVLHYMIS